MDNQYIVIMAGGSGTRLWPISRAHLPKQFHKFSSNERSLLQETYDRVKDLAPKKNIYVSLVADILKMTEQQLPEIPTENYIIEPVARNTAPAIGLIATLIYNKNPDAVITTVASDHTVEKLEEFQKSLRLANKYVGKNPAYIVTIGIEPTDPNTGYGYIKKGRKFTDWDVFVVERFVEKPNIETAKRYLKEGNYLWNASYFTFNAKEMLANFTRLSPEISKKLSTIASSINSKEFNKILLAEYSNILKEPIDTVIIEKYDKIATIPADLGWSDVGSWESLYELISQRTGKKTISRGHHIGVDNKNCLIYAHDKLLATVGLEDIVIVDTPDVTLVCHKNKSQDIKKLVEKIKQKGQDKYL